ncbi:hypothetical protein M0R88_16885 [Halorussus gelatinilyticus]|uniref:Uncharacterized protein n=1 Tax=Halorussus gelatinilyticus TaxID=2937524 RepID=A0A8U0IHL9_9EURY|nr:hypothetical protein [Halorussus gelatinilyticus]UPW00176.1 hypothetical protein M0R88_16885 [Halorussus gelatinilyticus]
MHSLVHLLSVALVLLVTVAVGVCVHELLHVVPLSFTDAEYAVTVFPSDGESAFQSALTGSLVRVEVTNLPDATPDSVLRGAALAPLALALPLALVAAGVLPNPVATGDHFGTVALLALTGCGLPSPADWSVAWHGSELADN